MRNTFKIIKLVFFMGSLIFGALATQHGSPLAGMFAKLTTNLPGLYQSAVPSLPNSGPSGPASGAIPMVPPDKLAGAIAEALGAAHP